MRSLFVKIFLSFFLAMMLVIITTVVLLALLRPNIPLPEDRRLAAQNIRFYGQQVAGLMEGRDKQAVDELSDRMEEKTGIRAVAFDARGREIPSHEASLEARDLAAKLVEKGGLEARIKGENQLIAIRIPLRSRGFLVVVGNVPKRPAIARVWRMFNPNTLVPRLLATMVIAVIVSYLLAWNLSSPIKKLKTATKSLAEGDLKVRVGQQMGRRRDEIAQLGRDFDVMAERVESLMGAQGNLLRDISHELRSPLARLNVALELARQRSGPGAAEALARIEREAERLNELIGELLTLTLLESGAEKLERTTFSLSDLVREIVDDASFEARNRDRNVNLQMSREMNINASEELLRRAVENVVRNALNYTAEGTMVEVSLYEQLEDEKRYAVIKVRDHGPGVPESALADLFRPFYRVAEARDRNTGGTGIGLSITERAVSLHGGTVKASNAPDGGLILEMSLPLVSEAA